MRIFSDQSQRKLPSIVSFVLLDEILNGRWHVSRLQIVVPYIACQFSHRRHQGA